MISLAAIFSGIPDTIEILDIQSNPLNCSNCDLKALKVFLKNVELLGNSKCDGTNTYVINHDFPNWPDVTTTTDAMTTTVTMTTTDDVTTLVSNSTNNTGSSQGKMLFQAHYKWIVYKLTFCDRHSDYISGKVPFVVYKGLCKRLLYGIGKMFKSLDDFNKTWFQLLGLL